MGEKSRLHFAQTQNLTQEQFDKIFTKDINELVVSQNEALPFWEKEASIEQT